MLARYAIVISSVCWWTLAALAAGLAMTATACSDAGKCRFGDIGCKCDDGFCDVGTCSDGMCIESNGDDLPDAAVRDAGAPPEVDCDGDTVEEVCAQFCDALCQNQERFCLTSQCSADACSSNGEVAMPCAQQCNTVACARNLCMNQLDETMRCDTFGFESDGEFVNLCLDADPLCVPVPELGCTNTCGTNELHGGGQLVGNDKCEDGHDTDSESSRCPRGTDCDDCGPHPCVAPGETCVNNGDCCGFFGTGALCVDPDGTGSMDPYCLTTCDDRGECDDGFTCVPTDGPHSVCVPEQ